MLKALKMAQHQSSDNCEKKHNFITSLKLDNVLLQLVSSYFSNKQLNLPIPTGNSENESRAEQNIFSLLN